MNFSLKQRRNQITITAVVLVVTLLSVNYATSFATVPNPIIAIYNKLGSQTPASYIISTNSTYIWAKNGDTGKIDYQGTDAATVINSAISATQNGALIFIKQGDYLISSPINLKHGLTLQGESPGQIVTGGNAGTHLKEANGANINILQSNGTNLVYMMTIRDMFIDGNHANNSLGNGIYLNNKVNDFLLDNVYIDGSPENCFLADQAWNYRFTSNTFEHCQLDGMFIKAGQDAKIIGNKFLTNVQHGAEFGTTNGGVGALMFEGNYVEGNTKMGVRTVNTQRAVIIGNVWELNSNGNTNVYNNLQIENNGSYSKIEGNQFIGSSTIHYEIAITHATSNNILILGNALDAGGVSPTISDSGTNTMIRNNYGYTTETKGTGTITSGTTSVVVTHGLSYTPAAGECTITPTSTATNDYGNVWISSITSTQFTVNVRSDPGASNLTFAWACNRV